MSAVRGFLCIFSRAIKPGAAPVPPLLPQASTPGCTASAASNWWGAMLVLGSWELLPFCSYFSLTLFPCSPAPAQLHSGWKLHLQHSLGRESEVKRGHSFQLPSLSAAPLQLEAAPISQPQKGVGSRDKWQWHGWAQLLAPWPQCSSLMFRPSIVTGRGKALWLWGLDLAHGPSFADTCLRLNVYLVSKLNLNLSLVSGPDRLRIQAPVLLADLSEH